MPQLVERTTLVCHGWRRVLPQGYHPHREDHKDILLKLTEHKAAIAELQKGAATYGYSIEMS